MELLQCYNKGCGAKFDSQSNKEDSCQYHPGAPVFHDAMKGWSCCKKRSTDFTEFLNFPGCTRGTHSNVKPAEPEKPAKEDIPDVEEVKVEAPRQPAPAQVIERPSEDESMQRLKVTVSPSLTKALEKQLQQMSLQQNSTGDVNVDSKTVAVGTSCKNCGCKATYQSEASDLETCQYHPGVAIFHEGMKYWSCCNRKTSDFSNFLDQEGCASGKHLWIKKEDPDKMKSCRTDWFQTAPSINISVFAKTSIPDQSYVEVNRVKCKIYLVFEGGKSIFEQTLVLKNPIIPEKSEVKMLGTKVEIILKKQEAFSWPTLELQPDKKQTGQNGV